MYHCGACSTMAKVTAIFFWLQTSKFLQNVCVLTIVDLDSVTPPLLFKFPRNQVSPTFGVITK